MTAHLLVLAIALGGFVALALGMDRHAKDVLGAAPSAARRKVLRGGGWLALAVAMALCMWVWGGSVGSVEWFAVLSATAVPLVMLVLPHWTERAKAAAPVRRPARPGREQPPAAQDIESATPPVGVGRRVMCAAAWMALFVWPPLFGWWLVQAV